MITSSNGLPYISPRSSQKFRLNADPFKRLQSFSPSGPSSLQSSHELTKKCEKMPSLVAVTAKLKAYSSLKTLTSLKKLPINPAKVLELNRKNCNKRIEDAIKISKISQNADLVDFTFGLQDN
jgi:hypothetical protein